MKTTIENSDLVIIYNESSYTIDSKQSATFTKARNTNISMSSNGRGLGQVYETNTNAPDTVEAVIRDIEESFMTLLNNIYLSKDRLDLIWSKNDGLESWVCNDAIISVSPINRSIAEGEGAFDITLSLQVPNIQHEIKAPE